MKSNRTLIMQFLLYRQISVKKFCYLVSISKHEFNMFLNDSLKTRLNTVFKISYATNIDVSILLKNIPFVMGAK